MSKTEVPILETAVQKTHVWLKDLSQRMGWGDQHLSYLAIRAVLHALRDRLPIEVAVKFGAQLPVLIRGFYYEGWVPSHTPLKIHRAEDFLQLVSNYVGQDMLELQAGVITENVFKLLVAHLPAGEIRHLKKVLPEPIASLWPPDAGES